MKCLIVVDMQNDFIDGSLGTKEAVAILPKVVEKVENYDGRIIFTKDTHTADYMNTQEGKNLPVVHCVEGEAGWKLASALEDFAAKKGCVTYNKPSFGSVELAEAMKQLAAEESIEEFELCGLCTDICVISNAMLLKAFLPEIPVAVDASCCAGVTPESHKNALEAMKMCQISIRNEEK